MNFTNTNQADGQISNRVNNNSFKQAPPQQNPIIIQRLVAAYKLWHDFLPHIPKTSRYTLAAKIDTFFLDTVELIFIASYLSKQQKQLFVQKSSAKLDVLKLFLRVAWEIKALDNKKYIALSEKLDEIGRMLGGWLKQLSR